MDGWIDGQMHRWTKGWMYRQWTNGWTKGRTKGLMDGQMQMWRCEDASKNDMSTFSMWSNVSFICVHATLLVNLSVGCSIVTLVADYKNKLNWHDEAISAMETIGNDTASASCIYGLVTAPAQQHAAGPSLYTALFQFSLLIPNRTFPLLYSTPPLRPTPSWAVLQAFLS